VVIPDLTQLTSANRAESKGVEHQDHGRLAAKITEFHGLTVLIV
jgi:hypothetical protein